MTHPYRSRIMLSLPGEEPVELVRFSSRVARSTVAKWIRDLSDEWTVVVEQTGIKAAAPRLKIKHYAYEHAC